MSLLSALPAALAATLALSTAARGAQAAQGPPAQAAPSVRADAAQARRPAGAAQRLREIARELESGLAGRDPELARSLGVDVTPEPLADDSAWWTRFLQARIHELEALWQGELDPLERSLRDALEDRAREEFVLANALPRRRWDPAFYVERAASRLERALASPAVERADLLMQVAEPLRAAQDALVFPRNVWITEARERLVGLGERLAAAGEGSAIDDARQACRTFDEWLVEAAVESGEVVPRLGPRNWEALVQASSGTRRSTREIRIALLRQVARLDNELADAPPRPAVGLDELPAALERALSLATFARNEARRPDLIPPLDFGLSLETVPGPRFPDPLVGVEHGPGHTRLLLATPHEAWPAALTEEVLRSLEGTTLAATAVRLGLPGEGLRLGLAPPQDVPGPLAWSRSNREGWGVYALDWLVRHPRTAEALAEKAPTLAVELRRAHLRQAALFLATLEWHALEQPEDAVVDGLCQRTGIAPALARLELGRIGHDPLLGVGALGALECADLERAVAEGLEAPDPLRTTLGLLLRHPLLRPADLVRRGLVGTRGQ